MSDARPRELAPEEELQIREALRVPRGRYSAQRASHIAGIPERTIYHWAREKHVVPDFYTDHPKAWSYRDLVMLRLFVFFRARQKPVEDAAAHVRTVRKTLELPDTNLRTVRSTRYSLYLDDAVEDLASPQMAFSAVVPLLAEFDLMAPLDDTGLRQVWGPDLVRPTANTAISPWVLAGEPCIRNTRLPTSTLYALTHERHLLPVDIARLYTDVSEMAIIEAIDLEARMRSRDPVAAE